MHTFTDEDFGNGGVRTLGDSDVGQRQTVPVGDTVRLRLINTNSGGETFDLRGTSARLVAVDGGQLNEPAEVPDPAVKVAAGGRYDLVFPMPDQPVRLDVAGTGGLLLSPAGAPAGAEPPAGESTLIDPLHYGQPASTPYGADTDFDRRFTLVLDQKLTLRDGRLNYVYSVNGRAFPDIPTQVVKPGEVVRFTVVNRSLDIHPMHPHGHHVLVLSRNGEPVTGSPLWMDTFEVGPGEVWEVAMRADNPGIWMDHCHNLHHAANGMMFHLADESVTTPFEVGHGTPNHPE